MDYDKMLWHLTGFELDEKSIYIIIDASETNKV